MVDINITLVQPLGYTHSLALLEVAEYCKFQLERLGYNVSLKKNRYTHDAINIVFGAHLLDLSVQLPTKTVIFNTEQVGPDNKWTKNPNYLKLLKNYYVWDYSQDNAAKLGHKNWSLVNVGYERELARIDLQLNKEWDLLFYGSMNPRREKIIKDLHNRGVSVKCIFNLYAAERDFYLARTRAVLNLHFYDAQVFQQIRAFYPLINNIPVVSECYPKSSAPQVYEDALFTPDPDKDFVAYVVNLMSKLGLLEEESSNKLKKFKESGSDSGIENAISATKEFYAGTPNDPNNYSKINLGSGKDYKTGYLNIDIRKSVFPDLICDLSQRIVFPLKLTLTDGRECVLEKGSVEEIVANDVLEHVPDLEQLMTNCLDLLQVGGKFKINVPYDLSLGAWQDPTHIRGFNQNSWLYYTDWFWYLDWFEHRFEVGELKYKPTELGKAMLEKGANQQLLIRTPRAIDSMSVVLTKIATTLEERTKARAFSGRLFGFPN